MQNAIITGASRGVGEATAVELARLGYRLYLSARNEDGLQALKSRLEVQFGVEIVIHSVDFSKRSEVIDYAAWLSNNLESVDVLVNNLGMYRPDSLLEMTELDEQMEVNFYSTFALTQRLLPFFTEQKAGHIFNMLSIRVNQPWDQAVSYSISKHAFEGYHKLLQQTLRPLGVKVTGIYPASINTSSWDGEEGVPREEFIQPEDIAGLISTAVQSQHGTVVSDIHLDSINPNF